MPDAGLKYLIRGLGVALVGLLLPLAALAAGPSPEAIAKAKLANEQCFACHSQEGLAHPPQADLDLAKLRGLLVDKPTFEDADHGKFACTKCHNEGYDDFPHEKDAADNTSTCQDCHAKKADKIQAEFDKSVHAKHLADKFSCTTCHDLHSIKVAKNQDGARKIVAQDNRICLGCHDSDQTFARFAPEKKARPPIDEIHDWLPNARTHWKAVRCVECHTPLGGDMLSHEILNKDRAERKCVSCHSADTSLKVRLYRHLAKQEQEKLGFMNSVVLSENYVIGATRNLALDSVMIGLVALTLLGVLVHAALRVLMHTLRRRKKDD
ncbi:hypothetical protein C0V76_01345 [Uliginosibacterium sp. TH139]|nr:hypothetical protein C0V76_01345 [Uliginosibacterium sp. TH139]